MRTTSKTGLVLTGGGARGAYQAGALRAATEIAAKIGIPQPFPIITGNSAGAINGAYLASYAKNMPAAAKRLELMWANLTCDYIFRADLFSLLKIGLLWAYELTTGSLSGRKKSRAFLNTEPLYELITRGISFSKIQRYIDDKLIHAFAITAVNYGSGASRTFFDGHTEVQEWVRTRRKGVRTRLTVDHIMASTAIPLLFPPVKVEENFYGDGSLRNYRPLSPAIHLGADKLFVVAVRRKERDPIETHMSPTAGRILGVIFNAILLDAIDLDYETLSRVNQSLEHSSPNDKQELRQLPICLIRPSQDLGYMAAEEAHHLPANIRYLLRGLGNIEEDADLVSYLLFEGPYTKRLIQLGYQDAWSQEDEIVEFFRK